MLFRPRASTLLIAAILASLLTWLWSEWQPANFTLEVTLASSVRATSKVYFDLGRGFNEADTSSLGVPGGNIPVTCRFLLPEGTYQALRFDPIDDSGTVTFSGMRIVGPGGAVVRSFAPEDFTPLHQISEHTVNRGVVRMVVASGLNDPYYAVALPRPLLLQAGPGQMFIAGRFALIFALAAGLIGLGGCFLRRHPSFFAELRGRAVRRPHTFLAVIAVVAAVAASYPVVFCGRSFVSPNNGVVLLYQAVPTLPGLVDTRQENVRGSDIGAMMWQHLPYTVLENRALLHEGELPLWNRYNSCGVPLLGQGQSMLGDPLHLPELLAGGTSSAFDLKFILAKALFAAGLGFTVWAATRGLSVAALVTFASAFVGFFSFRLNHPAVFSVGVAPWVLWCWVRLVQASTRREAAGWCLGLILANGSLLTSGTVKEADMLLLALNLAGGLALLFSADAWREKWRKLALAAAAGLILLLLSAPVWLTFLDSLRHAYTTSDRAQIWQLPRHRVIGLFDDVFYRELSIGHNVIAPSLNFFLLLGVLWFCASLHRLWRNSLALVMAAGTLGATSLAFAWVPEGLILRLPLLPRVVHLANTFSCVAMVFLAVLAGYGFQAAEVALGKKGWWRPALATLLLLAGLLLAYFQDMAEYWSGHPGLGQWRLIVPVHPFFFTYLALLLAALVGLTLVAAWCLRRRRWPALAVFAALLAAGVLLIRQGLHYSATLSEDYFTTPGVRADLQAPSPAVESIKTALAAEPFRVVGLQGNLLPGWNDVYNLEGISGPDALMNPWYRELAGAGGFERVSDWRLVVRAETLPALKPVCDFLNVKYYLASQEDRERLGSILQPVGMADLDVWRSATPWPRAFFTDQVLAYDTLPQFVALIRADAGHPFAAVQTGDRHAPAASTASAVRLVVPADDYRLTTNSTSFRVTAPKAGVIVLQEAWLPRSFRVTLNGQPADYFRVNHAFKGVAVPAAGTYRVTFTYRPEHWTLALILSGTGLTLLLAGVVMYGPIGKRSGLAAAPRAIARLPMQPPPASCSLSVIVPVFNERATAQKALDALLAKEIPGMPIEVVLVESNSTDGTREIVLGYRDHPRVKLILEDRPRGKGHAVRAGFAQATGDIFLIQDADLEYDLADYETLLQPLVDGRQAFVLGSRHGRGGWAIRRFSDQPVEAFVLNVAHWSFTLLINASLGIWLKDPFTMYKVFRRECLEGLTFTCNRFDFDWELLIKLVRRGHRPIEIPVTYRSRSFKAGKKIRLFRDPLTWLVAWARARFGPL